MKEQKDKFFDVPDLYNDYMGEIMSIPVFDTTHPDIQDQFSTTAGATSIASDDRLKRHAMDWQSFETQFQREMARFGVVRCAICRHPMERENMLIDTDLQGEILNFLRDKVGPWLPR